MQSLREFRVKARALPDLLPWAALVAPDVVLLKSGAFLAAWEYSGPDLDSSTRHELRALAVRLNSALKLGDGWMIHADSVRGPVSAYAPRTAFPDRTTQLIEDERRAQFEREAVGFTSRNVLALTWFPPPDAANKAASVFIEGRVAGTAQQTLERFQHACLSIEGNLESIVKIRRLSSQEDELTGEVASELLGHLERCVTLREGSEPFRMSFVPMYLDAVLGRHQLVTGFTPQIDGRFVRALSITGLPQRSWPGIMDFLGRLPVAYRWSSRFIFMDPVKAEKILGKYRSRWAQKRVAGMNLVREALGGQASHHNADAVSMAGDAVDAMAEASSGMVHFGYYSTALLLAHEDLEVLNGAAREVAKVIQAKQFECRIEDVNAVEVYLGSHPGNTKANVRRPIIHTLNLAHLIPFTSVWAGPDHNPCPFYPRQKDGSPPPPLLWTRTSGATPFRLCLHSGDLGHVAALGPTGAGKSTLLATIIAQQFRYAKAQVFAFDKGYALLPLCWAAGGEHYDIGGDAAAPVSGGAASESGAPPPVGVSFCPLGAVHEHGERVWAAEWIEQLVHLQGVGVSPKQRQEIFRAVTQLGETTTESRHRTLTNYTLVLQDVEVRNALKPYTLSGMAGTLLDSERDALSDSSFQVFEIGHLLGKGEKLVLPVITYLFHRLEQRFRGEPTLLVLDEAWVMLGHPVFKEKIREWLKVLRKANVAVVFATQSLTDLSRSGIADVIYESCPTKILLPNPEAATENIRPLYQAMGLNSRQIEILSMATPKRQYYMLHPDGRRLFELGLTAPQLAFVGASGKEDLERVRELRAALGDAWPAQWLRERGCDAAAEQWESYTDG